MNEDSKMANEDASMNSRQNWKNKLKSKRLIEVDISIPSILDKDKTKKFINPVSGEIIYV